ncbi:uncharacterized protein LOC121728706 [Aricia agestis]|uniref:uncharacterized protein LOC121728706 n=1 Tax=Aricia agestis TaxID=91739 RepID=UPI001C20831F|nr:uncharacterized protein LOC121728706 [Aricia agestis]
MSRPFAHIVVLHIILQLLVRTEAAPLTTRDFVSLFANPVNDFIDLFMRDKKVQNKTSTTKPDDLGPLGAMIEVPPNHEPVSCARGAVKDRNGVCRTPF